MSIYTYVYICARQKFKLDGREYHGLIINKTIINIYFYDCVSILSIYSISFLKTI